DPAPSSFQQPAGRAMSAVPGPAMREPAMPDNLSMTPGAAPVTPPASIAPPPLTPTSGARSYQTNCPTDTGTSSTGAAPAATLAPPQRQQMPSLPENSPGGPPL